MIRLNEESQEYIQGILKDYSESMIETYMERRQEAIENFISSHNGSNKELKKAEKQIKKDLEVERQKDLDEYREKLECECAVNQLIEAIAEELRDAPLSHLEMMVNFLHRADVIEAYRGTEAKVAEMLSESLEYEADSREED